MMQGWTMAGWGYGHGTLGMIIMLVFWVLIIVSIVMVVRWLVNQGRRKVSGPMRILSKFSTSDMRGGR